MSKPMNKAVREKLLKLQDDTREGRVGGTIIGVPLEALESLLHDTEREARIDENKAWLRLYLNARKDKAVEGIKLEAIIERLKGHIKSLIAQAKSGGESK